jgi:hypothetical protein
MYTSQGYMTADDYQEYLKDTDQGSTEIQLDDPPAWFTEIMPIFCPVCPGKVLDHESVTVLDASGEIYACVDSAGEAHR